MMAMAVVDIISKMYKSWDWSDCDIAGLNVEAYNDVIFKVLFGDAFSFCVFAETVLESCSDH